MDHFSAIKQTTFKFPFEKERAVSNGNLLNAELEKPAWAAQSLSIRHRHNISVLTGIEMGRKRPGTWVIKNIIG